MKILYFICLFVTLTFVGCKKDEPNSQSQNNSNQAQNNNNQAYNYIVGKKIRLDLTENIQMGSVVASFPDGNTAVQIGSEGQWGDYPTDYSQSDKIIVDYSGGSGSPVSYIIEQVNSIKLVTYQALDNSNGHRRTYTIL